MIGAGVHYGSAPGEAPRYRGKHVVIVGGANSAGQAALHMAEQARQVTVVCRAPSLDKNMSRYLIERIQQHPRIEVRSRSNVTEARGDEWLESVVIADEARGEDREVPADAMFVLIGAQPVTTGVEGWLRRDRHGFLMTGQDVLRDGERDRWWSLGRDPYPLESSQPGVFVAGDLRHGSIKRVASAVGEGAMAVDPRPPVPRRRCSALSARAGQAATGAARRAAMNAASSATNPSSADPRVYCHWRPRKYRPGWSVTPRRWRGRPWPSRTGTWSQA